MKSLALLTLILSLLLLSQPGWALSKDDSEYGGPPEWPEFQQFMKQERDRDNIRGLSYFVSGAVATVGGMVGYYSADDPLARGIYSLAQTVGIASMGYGAANWWIGNSYNNFYDAVEGTDLSLAQKNRLLENYLIAEQEQKRKERIIKASTHALIAITNFYTANREDNKSVRTAMQFIGAANAFMALSFTF